jgi:hypothetical protein
MSFRVLSLTAISAILAATAAGCLMPLDEVLGEAARTSDDVPVFSSNVAYLTVAPPDDASDDSPDVRRVRAAFGKQTIVFDTSDAESPKVMCTHVAAEVPAKYDEMRTPRHATCAAPATATGTQGLPEGIDGTWSGYGKGGCGTWAVATCNRILGDTPASSPVTKDEWNGIARAIKQDADGGSTVPDRSAYYEDKGYCVVDKRFDGTAAEYQELTDKHLEGCDIKLSFWKRKADGTYVNGHVETVTGASLGGVTTSSWGKQAIIEGGSKGGFKHSEDGKSFRDEQGNPLWPAGSTEVEVSYVCKCNAFQKLAKAALGG